MERLKASSKNKLGKSSWIGVAVFEPEVMKYVEPGEGIAGHGIPARALIGSKRKGLLLRNTKSLVRRWKLRTWRRADDHFREKTKLTYHSSIFLLAD